MFKGKALLVMTRTDASNKKDFQWDIDPYIQSLNGDDPGGEVSEAFSFIMQYDHHPAPAAAYKMAVGDTIRVAVSFEIHYSLSYEGEYDSDLYLTKERVLRRQPFTDKVYRKRYYRFWREDQRRHG